MTDQQSYSSATSNNNIQSMPTMIGDIELNAPPPPPENTESSSTEDPKTLEEDVPLKLFVGQVTYRYLLRITVTISHITQ